MAEDLIIVGAGGFSGGVAAAVQDINRIEPRWNVVGFLDDDPAKQGQEVLGYPVLGPVASACLHQGARFVIGVASHRRRMARQAIAATMGLPLDRFAKIVHPAASVCRSASLGAGTVVLQGTVVNHGVSVGNHVLISEQCSLGHDSVIEDFVTMASGVIVSGCVRAREGTYLGAGSRILEFLEIGEHALVGIGAVVVRDVAPRITVFGNPARALRGSRYAGQ
jgi:sugar O-acyltransferase (sialic acid O-acetyltransferase NeuD family)